MYTTPIIYIFFNRPEVTRRTFAEVARVKPAKLYLISDGPRPGRTDDVIKGGHCRKIVESMITWPCDVTYDYAETNMGCGKRLASGLTAAFAKLGEAVVIEDDILPHPDFFKFCAEMLDLYRDDPKVHAISGFNPIGKYAAETNGIPTLFYSMWGWASWQRAWKDYDFNMTGWDQPAVKEDIRRYVNDPLLHQWHAHSFNLMEKEKLDTWDYQWSYTMLKHRRFSITSSVNLITNLGFDADATHTTSEHTYIRGLRTYPLPKSGNRPYTSSSDRVHDKVYGRVVMTPTRWKITALRLMSRSRLTQAVLKLA
jgi:hypothetical protein